MTHAISCQRRRGFVGCFALVSVLLAIWGCAPHTALYQPPPVSFARVPVEDVEAALYAGASRRGWVPTKVREGLIQATLSLRAHLAVVEIAYNTDVFRLRYVRSENLNFVQEGDGPPQIHPHFNIWQRNLIRDISEELANRRKRQDG